MNETIHFAYKNDGVKTVETNLNALAEQLPPDKFRLVYGTISPILKELSDLREVVAKQAERIEALETQQGTSNGNIHGAFNAIGRLTNDVAILKGQKDGPGTIDQQEQIETYLAKSPKKRAAFGELRDFLGVTAPRFSQIIRGAKFIVLQNRHDRRRRLLQLPAKF